jgi:hypothetical protein
MPKNRENEIGIIGTLNALRTQIWITTGKTDMRKLTTAEFISRAKEIHGDTYDYSEIMYSSARQKVKIICALHGRFEQTPNNHIYSGKGCPSCSGNKKYTTPEFVCKANAIHEFKYDYSKSNYIGCFDKIIIKCPIHGDFLQSPSEHLYGKGCIKCTHIISDPEIEFLNYYNIPTRNYYLPKWKKKPVDGYDPTTNTIYEFLGDYWHGNLNKYPPEKLHPKRKITYRELNDRTMTNLNRVKSLGYEVKYIWESDWNKFKRGENPSPKLLSV